MAGIRDLDLGGGRTLPGRLLRASFSRSGGPGGQNVNKVSTRVDLRLDLAGAAELLGDLAVQRIREHCRHRLDGDGDLVVFCDEHRSQLRNVRGAVERMEQLLRAALRPTRKRRPTKPTRASQRRRVDDKRQRGELKRRRRSTGDD